MKDAAIKSKESRDEFVAIQEGADDDYEYDSDVENQPQYLFMELKSTASFKDIDIDAMLEHTTFDDFMRGLYVNKVQQAKPQDDSTDFQSMMKQIMQAGKDDQSDVKLEFEEASEEKKDDFISQQVEQQAMAAIRERRRRRTQSVIFDGSEKRSSAKE